AVERSGLRARTPACGSEPLSRGEPPHAPAGPLLSSPRADLAAAEPADVVPVPTSPLVGEPPAGPSPAPAATRCDRTAENLSQQSEGSHSAVRPTTRMGRTASFGLALGDAHELAVLGLIDAERPLDHVP